MTRFLDCDDVLANFDSHADKLFVPFRSHCSVSALAIMR